MLQWLRDNLRSFAWTLWVVIIAFVLFYVPDFLQGGDAVEQNSAARVGEYEVSFAELERAYRAREAEYRRALGESFSPDMLRQLGLERQLLQQLISSKILTREAERLGFEVSEDEIREAILEIPIFKDANGRWVGDQQYRQFLRNERFGTPADFEKLLAEDLLRSKLQAAMLESVYVPDAEVERVYRRDAERATVRYVQVPPGRFAGEVEVSQADLQSHFDANREQYRRPEQRVLSTVLVDIARLRQQVQVPAQEVRAYYDANQAEFDQQEQVRARHILINAGSDGVEDTALAAIESAKRRIEAGEDFGAVAREISEDPQSQNRGGELGFFARGSKPPDFEEAAFSAPVGELVGPVKSELVTGVGYHLIEVLARREGGVRPFESVKPSIESRLRNEIAQAQAEERAQALVTQLRGNPSEDLESLAAGATDLEFHRTEPFGQLDLVPRFGRAPALTEAVWNLEAGAFADPVKLPRGWLVARLDEIREPAIPELSEIEPEVRRAVAEAAQRDLAVERIAQAKSEIESGRPFDEVAAELGVEITTAEEFGHAGAVTGLGVAAGVTEAALSMTPGEVGGPVTTPQGVVLFEVTDRKTFDPAEFEGAREEARAQLENEQLARLQQAVIDQRTIEKDLVKINPKLVEDLELEARQ